MKTEEEKSEEFHNLAIFELISASQINGSSSQSTQSTHDLLMHIMKELKCSLDEIAVKLHVFIENQFVQFTTSQQSDSKQPDEILDLVNASIHINIYSDLFTAVILNGSLTVTRAIILLWTMIAFFNVASISKTTEVNKPQSQIILFTSIDILIAFLSRTLNSLVPVLRHFGSTITTELLNSSFITQHMPDFAALLNEAHNQQLPSDVSFDLNERGEGEDVETDLNNSSNDGIIGHGSDHDFARFTAVASANGGGKGGKPITMNQLRSDTACNGIEFKLPEHFTKTFNEDTDSRNEYKSSQTESSVYNERQACLEKITKLVEEYRTNGKRNSVLWFKECMLHDCNAVLQMHDCNFAYFAKLFMDMILFYGCKRGSGAAAFVNSATTATTAAAAVTSTAATGNANNSSNNSGGSRTGTNLNAIGGAITSGNIKSPGRIKAAAAVNAKLSDTARLNLESRLGGGTGGGGGGATVGSSTSNNNNSSKSSQQQQQNHSKPTQSVNLMSYATTTTNAPTNATTHTNSMKSNTISVNVSAAKEAQLNKRLGVGSVVQTGFGSGVSSGTTSAWGFGTVSFGAHTTTPAAVEKASSASDSGSGDNATTATATSTPTPSANPWNKRSDSGNTNNIGNSDNNSTSGSSLLLTGSLFGSDDPVVGHSSAENKTTDKPTTGNYNSNSNINKFSKHVKPSYSAFAAAHASSFTKNSSNSNSSSGTNRLNHYNGNGKDETDCFQAVGKAFPGLLQFFFRFILYTDNHRFNQALVDCILAEITHLSKVDFSYRCAMKNKKQNNNNNNIGINNIGGGSGGGINNISGGGHSIINNKQQPHLSKFTAALEHSTMNAYNFALIVTKLKLLGRFLGLLTFYPHWTLTADAIASPQLQSQALELAIKRAKLCTILPLTTILENAYYESTLCLQIPWVVDFLRMMRWDATVSQYNPYRETLSFLYAIQCSERFRLASPQMSANRLYIRVELHHLWDDLKVDTSLLPTYIIPTVRKTTHGSGSSSGASRHNRQPSLTAFHSGNDDDGALLDERSLAFTLLFMHHICPRLEVAHISIRARNNNNNANARQQQQQSSVGGGGSSKNKVSKTIVPAQIPVNIQTLPVKTKLTRHRTSITPVLETVPEDSTSINTSNSTSNNSATSLNNGTADGIITCLPSESVRRISGSNDSSSNTNDISTNNDTTLSPAHTVLPASLSVAPSGVSTSLQLPPPLVLTSVTTTATSATAVSKPSRISPTLSTTTPTVTPKKKKTSLQSLTSGTANKNTSNDINGVTASFSMNTNNNSNNNNSVYGSNVYGTNSLNSSVDSITSFTSPVKLRLSRSMSSPSQQQQHRNSVGSLSSLNKHNRSLDHSFTSVATVGGGIGGIGVMGGLSPSVSPVKMRAGSIGDSYYGGGSLSGGGGGVCGGYDDDDDSERAHAERVETSFWTQHPKLQLIAEMAQSHAHEACRMQIKENSAVYVADFIAEINVLKMKMASSGDHPVSAVCLVKNTNNSSNSSNSNSSSSSGGNYDSSGTDNGHITSTDNNGDKLTAKATLVKGATLAEELPFPQQLQQLTETSLATALNKGRAFITDFYSQFIATTLPALCRMYPVHDRVVNLAIWYTSEQCMESLEYLTEYFVTYCKNKFREVHDTVAKQFSRLGNNNNSKTSGNNNDNNNNSSKRGGRERSNSSDSSRVVQVVVTETTDKATGDKSESTTVSVCDFNKLHSCAVLVVANRVNVISALTELWGRCFVVAADVVDSADDASGNVTTTTSSSSSSNSSSCDGLQHLMNADIFFTSQNGCDGNMLNGSNKSNDRSCCCPLRLRVSYESVTHYKNSVIRILNMLTKLTTAVAEFVTQSGLSMVTTIPPLATTATAELPQCQQATMDSVAILTSIECVITNLSHILVATVKLLPATLQIMSAPPKSELARRIAVELSKFITSIQPYLIYLNTVLVIVLEAKHQCDQNSNTDRHISNNDSSCGVSCTSTSSSNDRQYTVTDYTKIEHILPSDVLSTLISCQLLPVEAIMRALPSAVKPKTVAFYHTCKDLRGMLTGASQGVLFIIGRILHLSRDGDEKNNFLINGSICVGDVPLEPVAVTTTTATTQTTTQCVTRETSAVVIGGFCAVTTPAAATAVAIAATAGADGVGGDATETADATTRTGVSKDEGGKINESTDNAYLARLQVWYDSAVCLTSSGALTDCITKVDKFLTAANSNSSSGN